MRAFSWSTIRNVLKAIEHSGDRINMLAVLMANEDNQLSIANMLIAEPEKVELFVDKVKVVFAADTYSPNQTYRFVPTGNDFQDKITCIRVVRAATKIGLEEAKDLVERVHFSNMPELFERAVMAEILTSGYYIEKIR